MSQLLHDDEDLPPDVIRGSQEIARRALTLFAVVGLGMGAPKDDLVSWLKAESLWDELTPMELAYVSSSSPTRQQVIDASWRSEALLVLLWSLRIVEVMPSLEEQCKAGEFQKVLPPFTNESVQHFISTATRRPAEALFEFADAVLNSHWTARDARIHNKPMPAGLDIGIIQERHHAINWVIGYDGLPWDEVTTDT